MYKLANKINLKNKIKYKLINHIMKTGNKRTCENLIIQGLKMLQKSKTKSHSEIMKLAISNATPTFRIMELKENRKKKRKKGTKKAKEIPAFLSHYTFRTSWAIKLIANSFKKSSKKILVNFSDEIISTAQNNGEAVRKKTEVQSQALKKKFYFKYYRW